LKWSRMIVEWLCQLLACFLRFFGRQNLILMEVENGTRENVEAVLKEMLQRKSFSKYKFVLISMHPEELRHLENRQVRVETRVWYGDSRKALRRFAWLKLRAAMIIDENLQIQKKASNTIHVYLSHGSPVKSIRESYNCTPDTDYMLSQAPFWNPINEYELRIPVERMVTLGFPRNDALFSDKSDLLNLFDQKFNKLVVWYPTFRQHRIHEAVIPQHSSFSIPLIHDEAAARRINELAAQYGILLVVKPHPVQDLSLIRELQLDHLIFIYDDFFVSNGITAHDFLGKTDALITDYSSIIFDYLLTGKPVALTIEDYEQYKEQQGFAIDFKMLKSCSTILDTPEDFAAFFRDLVEGNDPLKEKREEVMRLTNTYLDGNSTKRVVDWMEELLQRPR